jgi:thiamine biosynthesis protein ThiS
MTQTAAQRPAIAVTVNGDERRIAEGSTLGDLLREHDLDPRMVVVERNREILRDRSTFDQLQLEADDSLEIVHFVGGG